MGPRDLFTEEERAEIEQAIDRAEKVTSGEIRVHLENTCDEDILDHSAWIFEQLEMHKTEKRNGVLIYLAVADREFTVIGDAGINEKVPAGFWDKTSDIIISYFKEGDFKGGLIAGIECIGEDLKAHYPIGKKDKNELPNTISFGDDIKA
ncbi:MAG: TPM domain-containing protein [Flavobacteriales bacterium]